MTRISKELMTVAGIVPKLKLGIKSGKSIVSTGKHRVKILEDKIIKGLDPMTGKEIEYVEYTLEENGEKKSYRAKVKNKEGKLNYLVQHLADIKEGEEIYLEMKKAGIKSYIEVTPLVGPTRVEVDEFNDIEA